MHQQGRRARRRRRRKRRRSAKRRWVLLVFLPKGTPATQAALCAAYDVPRLRDRFLVSPNPDRARCCRRRRRRARGPATRRRSGRRRRRRARTECRTGGGDSAAGASGGRSVATVQQRCSAGGRQAAQACRSVTYGIIRHTGWGELLGLARAEEPAHSTAAPSFHPLISKIPRASIEPQNSWKCSPACNLSNWHLTRPPCWGGGACHQILSSSHGRAAWPHATRPAARRARPHHQPHRCNCR